MKENLHDIDKLFRAAINDHQEAPSAEVWDAIDKDLDRNKVADMKRKYFRLKRIAVGLLMLLLGTGIYTWKTVKVETGKDAAKNAVQNKGSASLAQSNNEEENANISDVTRAEKKHEFERADKMAVATGSNKKSQDMPAKMGRKPTLKNTTGQTGKEFTNRAFDSKMTINKGTQRTSITTGDLGLEQDGKGNHLPTRKENGSTQHFTVLPSIGPELLIAQQRGMSKKSNIPGNYVLPADIIMNARPGKIVKVKKPHALTATIFFAPDISFNRIRDGKRKSPSWRPDDSGDKIRNGEQHQFSSTFGLLIDFSINNHWSLRSGISLSNTTIHINPKTIYAEIDNNGGVRYLYNCSSGYLFLSSRSVTNPAIGDSIQAFESTNTLQYASIPLAVKYNYSFKKIDLFLSAGPSVFILTKDKIETGIEDGPDKEVSLSKKINGLQPSYFGAGVSLGASYSINRKIAVSLLPSYNFALTSSTKDATVKTYPNTISLAAGIRYKL